jgi:hypothetical protein
VHKFGSVASHYSYEQDRNFGLLIEAKVIAISVEQISMQTCESLKLTLHPVPYHYVLCSSHKFLLIITLRHVLSPGGQGLVKSDLSEGGRRRRCNLVVMVARVCGLCVGVHCIAFSVQCTFLNTATWIGKGSRKPEVNVNPYKSSCEVLRNSCFIAVFTDPVAVFCIKLCESISRLHAVFLKDIF